LALAGRDPPAGKLAPKEVEEDAPIRIRPRDDPEPRAYPGADAQLLVHLPPEARLQRLPGVALAPRELPEPAEMLRRIPSADEKPAATLDDRRGHLSDREARARRQLAEERQERGPVGRPRAPVPARVGRVEEDHDLSPADLEPPPVIVGETDGTVQDRAGGDGAHGHHHLGTERLELRGEDRPTPPRLARERAPVAPAPAARSGRPGGPALDGVRQVEELLQVEPEPPDLAAQDHPSGARPLPCVVDAGDSRSLADQDEAGVAPAEGRR
jgi:hypothetical protein